MLRLFEHSQSNQQFIHQEDQGARRHERQDIAIPASWYANMSVTHFLTFKRGTYLKVSI